MLDLTLNKKNVLIISIAGILIIAAVAYFLIFRGSPSVGTGAAGADGTIAGIGVNKIDLKKIDTAIFSSPKFTNLQPLRMFQIDNNAVKTGNKAPFRAESAK